MKKKTVLVQINTVINSGSVGHIAEDIAVMGKELGWSCYTAFGRHPRQSQSHSIRIGTIFDFFIHAVLTRLFDMHGFASFFATKRLLKKLEVLRPSVVHLHNVHGYYINVKVLFEWLAKKGIPVVWTLHDCWAYTGHCAYYTAVNCYQWYTCCTSCKQLKHYPKCVFYSNVKKNFLLKKQLFTLIPKSQMQLICPSIWLVGQVQLSFLQKYKCSCIYNGIDLNIFKPRSEYIGTTPLVLGVANIWETRKGFDDFIKLRSLLPNTIGIIMIGLSDVQIKQLPENIEGVKRTETLEKLVEYYNKATVLFNASVEETLGMTTIEAQACGTPVIAYDSTAIPETFDSSTGILVAPHDIEAVAAGVQEIIRIGKPYYSAACVKKVHAYFNKTEQIKKYFRLYQDILNINTFDDGKEE